MDPTTPHSDWSDILAACGQIPNDSAAWDEIEIFAAALASLGEEKRAARRSHRRDLARELSDFLVRRGDLIDRMLPPGASRWTATVADEVQAGRARQTLAELDAAIAEIDEVSRALAQARYGEHRPLQRRQAEAQDRIEAASETLTSLLNGGGSPAPETVAPSLEPTPVSPEHPETAAQPPVLSSGEEPPPLVTPPGGATLSGPSFPQEQPSGEGGDERPAPEEEPAAPPPGGSERAVLAPDQSGVGRSSTPPTAVVTPAAVPPTANVPRVTTNLRVPPELDGYGVFRARHWIEPGGDCVQAPWEHSDFEVNVNHAAATALARREFALLWIYSQTARERGFAPLIEPEDVRHLASLWNEPDLLTAALSATRAERLRRAVEAGEGAQGRWQMAAFLEALHPSLEEPLDPNVLDGIGFENSVLASTTVALLRLNLGDGHPVERLRDEQRKARKPSPGEMAAQLAVARQELQKLVAQQHSAAGGRIKLSHCRQAWTRFMKEAVQPLARRLQPSGDPADHRSWNLEVLRRQAIGLAERHDRIADQANADYEVRHVMDRAANAIVKAMLGVIQLAEDLRPDPANLPRANADLAALRPLLDSAAMGDPVEEACRLLFVRIVRGTPHAAGAPDEATPLALPLDTLIARPWLAATFERGPLPADGQLPAWLPLDLIAPRDTPRAAAALLSAPILRPEEIPADRLAWPAALRDALARINRRDLRACFVSASFIGEPEKTLIQSEQAEAQGALESRLQELRSQWREAEALVLPFEARLKELLDDGDRQIDGEGTVAPLQRELPLFDAWLRELGGFLRRTIDGQCARLQAEAGQRGPDILKQVNAAVETRRFADVLELLQGRAAGTETQRVRPVRETLWREEADSRWPEPLRVLNEAHRNSADGEGPESNLLRHWCTPPADAKAKSRLRLAFYRFLSGETKRSRDGSATSLHYTEEPSRFCIEVPSLLDWLNAQDYNPTFVPQARAFSEIVLMSPTTSAGNAHDFTKALHNSVTQGNERQSLIVFLAPRLSLHSEARAQTISQTRQRSRPIALLDDLDLCRLLAPGSRQPIGFIGLLEIVFEQMDWVRLQPFNTQDGQFVQAEMFVGRDQQALELATTMTYSRIFSGRKLGKSALLKYLEMSRNGRRLPSGQILRVLYLNAAGAANEPSLADKILERLTETLGFHVPAPPPDAGPGERLAHALKAWRRAAESESLLVILDEADSFVEEQIAGYARLAERSLSFAMMKAIPDEAKDGRGLPRVRFLLAGYRATNHDGGVWANAGQVLRLEPLGEEEAVRLIEGPLARLDIDAREQAPAIARRCGNQPAVLLRFGEMLLLHLQEHHSRLLREKVTVTSKDVADVFNSERVQGEIRTIVSNNFHGAPLGAVVWTALLVCLRRIPPGLWLEQAAGAVLDELRQVRSDLDWLSESDQDRLPLIESQLRDFKARQLICLDRLPGDEAWRCQMRFPHYLPVLTRDANLDAVLRQHLSVLQDKAQEGQSVTSLLPAHDLEDLRRYFHPGKNEPQEPPVRVLVAGGQWPAALQHEYGGLPDRLGLSSQDIATGEFPADGSRAVRNATAAHLETFLACGTGAPVADPPLFLGGLPLLRAALGEEENTGGAVLVFGLHRLTSARLAWWFGRLRTWHFETPGAVGRILALTSGIPLLVHAADDFLCGQVKPGADVPGDLFQKLEACLQAARTDALARLQVPGGEDALLPREREILKMAAVVARNSAGYPQEVTFPLMAGLGKADWEDYYADQLPGAAPLETTVEDLLAVRLLRFSGLLPLNHTGQFRARADDALYALAAAL